MNHRKTGILVALALAASGLAAVAGGQPSGSAVAAKQAGPHFRSAGKQRAPLAFNYEFLGKPTLGVPLQIDLYLTPTGPVSSADIELGADESLVVDGMPTAGSLRSRMPGGGWFQRIRVTPMAEGLNYVHVVALADVQGQQRGASFAVPVQVGDARPRKREGRLEVDSDGRAIISMPAVETDSR